MASSKLRRVLRGYEKVGDRMIVELPLKEVDVSVLQKAFGLPPNDPMYDCYPVGMDELNALQPFIAGTVDLRAYEFFLECDAQ
jgi:hypothetical protein